MAAPQAPFIGKTGKVALDESVFGESFHEHLVHRAVRAELNARRQGSASTSISRSSSSTCGRTPGCSSRRRSGTPYRRTIGSGANDHATHFFSGGLRPAGPPYTVARGGPCAPLRAGGSLAALALDAAHDRPPLAAVLIAARIR